MRQNKIASLFNNKVYGFVVVLCFVSAVAMAGAYYLGQREGNQEQSLVDLNEEPGTGVLAEDIDQETAETATDQVIGEGYSGDELDEIDEEPAGETEDKTNETASEDSGYDIVEETVASAASDVVSLNFQETDSLVWPVNGNVILNYSMDKSVYFSTLDQYKYNPAVVIQAEVNAKVLAAADGIVESVEFNEETGTTVVVDLGNDYQAVYGQLKEVPVSIGEKVSSNQVIGYVNEPTKYYSVEGSNLYFQLTHEGVPVNPLDHFE